MDKQLRYDVFIKGRHTDLFVLTEEHARYTDWYNWFNDQETNINNRHRCYPNTPALQLEYFKSEIEGSISRVQLGMMDKNQVFFGVISLSKIDHRTQNAELGIMIGLKEFRTAHYAIEGVSLLLEHGFSMLNLQRVYSGSHTRQLAEFYVRCLNFSHEGVLRKHLLQDGLLIDCHLIGILREDFQPIIFDV